MAGFDTARSWTPADGHDREYGPFILLALHIVIVWLPSSIPSFMESSCPDSPYPYYFLFALSDEFYLRAVVGGFLVGIGQDSFTYIRQGAVVLYTLSHTGLLPAGDAIRTAAQPANDSPSHLVLGHKRKVLPGSVRVQQRDPVGVNLKTGVRLRDVIGNNQVQALFSQFPSGFPDDLIGFSGNPTIMRLPFLRRMEARMSVVRSSSSLSAVVRFLSFRRAGRFGRQSATAAAITRTSHHGSVFVRRQACRPRW